MLRTGGRPAATYRLADMESAWVQRIASLDKEALRPSDWGMGLCTRRCRSIPCGWKEARNGIREISFLVFVGAAETAVTGQSQVSFHTGLIRSLSIWMEGLWANRRRANEMIIMHTWKAAL